MTNQQRNPEGDLLLRTLDMPADTNTNGNMFGDQIISQMNIGGGILAKKIAKGQVVTVKIDGITFHKLVNVEHMVCCYGK